MSLDKAILYGKEHRTNYRGSRQYLTSCRNHGGCPFCESNRLHKFRDRHPQTLEEAIYDVTQVHKRACPDCNNHLYIVRDDEFGHEIYICACCGLNMQMEEKENDSN